MPSNDDEPPDATTTASSTRPRTTTIPVSVEKATPEQLQARLDKLKAEGKTDGDPEVKKLTEQLKTLEAAKKDDKTKPADIESLQKTVIGLTEIVTALMGMFKGGGTGTGGALPAGAGGGFPGVNTAGWDPMSQQGLAYIGQNASLGQTFGQLVGLGQLLGDMKTWLAGITGQAQQTTADRKTKQEAVTKAQQDLLTLQQQLTKETDESKKQGLRDQIAAAQTALELARSQANS